MSNVYLDEREYTIKSEVTEGGISYMNAVDFLNISRFINDCPNCGHDRVGNGEGTLSVDDSIINRTCKCGFRFEYDVDSGLSKKNIQQAIDEALSEM